MSPSVETLWSRRNDLSAEGLALTGMVMLRTGDNRSAQIAQILEGKVKREGVLASWPSKYNPLLDLNDDNSAESTAFALRFLTHADPKSPLLEAAAQWLVVIAPAAIGGTRLNRQPWCSLAWSTILPPHRS